MGKVAILIFSLLFCITGFGQRELEEKVNEGVKLHDKQDYTGAIRKYDEVLAVDSNHFNANYEKAFSLSMLRQHDASIEICKKLARLYDSHPQMKHVYVTWANSLDNLEQPDEAIHVYELGLQEFPDFHLLHFNKAITYAKLGNLDKCQEATENAIMRNGLHASSHNLLGLMMLKQNKIASLLASLTFLAIEPNSQRSLLNLKQAENILGGNVSKGEGNNINVTIDADMLDSTKSQVNNFSSIELMMSLSAALDMDDKYKKESSSEKLERKMNSLISLLWELRKDAQGFFWEVYVPFFHEMQDKKMLTVYSHIATSSEKNKKNEEWLQKNAEEVDDFYKWLKGYSWD
jgi:tetratricopeptide (TPR) repeat protein